MDLAERLSNSNVKASAGLRLQKGPKAPPRQALSRLKDRATQQLFERLNVQLSDNNLSEVELGRLVQQELTELVEVREATLTTEERARLVKEVLEDVLGYGPLEQFLTDPTVTEIMVNGPNQIYIEQNGKNHLSKVRFASERHLRRIIERIVMQVGRRIDESTPMVDARLEDGSRVNAIIPPLAVEGSVLTVRKFAQTNLQVADLIKSGSISPDVAEFLNLAILGKLNILFSGGTGTGKTTALNAISSFIPEDDRVITIEDAVELQLDQEHIVRLESRPANVEGKGAVSIRDLVRNALRMRPDRIIVGEVRGAEALDMLQSMNTGHDGSMSTIHANSAFDALSRLETLTLMSGAELPLRAVRDQISSAIDLIVHLGRMPNGERRVVTVCEVAGVKQGEIELIDIYTFIYNKGAAQSRSLGQLEPTGNTPTFTRRLADRGIVFPATLFGAKR
jgi:pilus assembly protein CpaF